MQDRLRGLPAATLTVLLILAFSGCSATPGAVIATPDPGTTQTTAASDQSVVVEDDSDDQTADTDDEGDGGQTAALGSTVKLGDWEVTVVKVTKNANKSIRKANMFNDKPKGQFVLVDYTAKYVGSERKADVEWDISWSFTDAEQNVLDQASEVTPADKADKPTEARKGGVIKQQALFDVEPKLISGGIISAENSGSSEYADFQL
ncbi:MAG: DUF4352 domain-containing protein [Actinobacteria bacterium]|nr:DUF4352 domain-containing protein [Actinomycetota bacterium]